MKRLLYNIVPLILTILLVQGCKKVTTEGFTSITTYAVLTVEGESTMLIPKGSGFVDPGFTAFIGDEDVTDDVVVNSTVNTNVCGKYTIVYSVVNEDGFKAQKTRTVYVYDTTPSIIESRYYTVASGTNRVTATATNPYSGYKVLIYQISPGVFGISDFLGGYYEFGRSYGPDFAAVGTFQLNIDDTLELLTSYVPGWGDEVDDLVDGVVDVDEGIISFSAIYAGMSFNVILE